MTFVDSSATHLTRQGEWLVKIIEKERKIHMKEKMKKIEEMLELRKQLLDMQKEMRCNLMLDDKTVLFYSKEQFFGIAGHTGAKICLEPVEGEKVRLSFGCNGNEFCTYALASDYYLEETNNVEEK